MPLRLFISSVLALGYLTAPLAGAQALADQNNEANGPRAAVRTDTPTGLPVPRFVSLKQPKTPCRLGPSLDHPVRYTFQRQGLPVLVVAETTDNWRKIRDIAGDECWAHSLTLRAQTHVIAEKPVRLLSRPEPDAPLRARLAVGALAKIEGRKYGWVRLSVRTPVRDQGDTPAYGSNARPVKAATARQAPVRLTKGWAPASSLWGTDAAGALARGPQ